ARLPAEPSVARNAAGLEPLDEGLGVLGEALARFTHGGAEAGELDAPEPAADAEDHAAIRQVVEHAHLFGDAHRIVPRQHHHHGAELHPRGARRHVGEKLRHVGAHGVVVEMVLGAPDRIEAERLGEIRHRYLVAIDLAVRNGAADVLEERGHPDMHGFSPSAQIGLSAAKSGFSFPAFCFAPCGLRSHPSASAARIDLWKCCSAGSLRPKTIASWAPELKPRCTPSASGKSSFSTVLISRSMLRSQWRRALS